MKNKIKKIFYYLILFICFGGVVYSGYNLYKINSEYNKAEDEYEEIQKDHIQIIEKEEKEEAEKEEEGSGREIDFAALKEINPDIIGWIWLPNSKIDYPILQSKDNDDYLYHTYNGTKNSSGSIFVDYRNNGILNDHNTIIHGHNMKNGSMFHDLNKYVKKEYYEENKVFWIFTPEQGEIAFEIVSLYIEDVSNTKAYFVEGEYNDWIQIINSKTFYDTNGCDESKKTITLSTCHGSAGTSKRMLIHLQERD